MTDYKKLVEALRCKELEKIACPDCAERECVANSGRGLWCRVPKLMDDAADAIEELSTNWKYCSDLLNVALKYGCKSMTELLKLYEMEGAKMEVQDADS